jgi:uncharacterized cupin superfamily protein
VTTVEGTRFAFHRRQLGAAAGGRGLGTSFMELPPGKAAWPMHFHCANEEAVFIIQGTGELRIGDARVPLRAGDYVALPPGPQAAHQIYNNSGAPLVYLALSTMVPTDISVYPRSDKIGVFGGARPADRRTSAWSPASTAASTRWTTGRARRSTTTRTTTATTARFS